MELEVPYAFQVDSEIIKHVYETEANYLIKFDESVAKDYCVVYFASNDLYYPNTEVAFSESIIRKNRFEWFGNRIKNAHKHIFVRDIMKQWYLHGINSELNNPTKLSDFLKAETAGYKVIMVGASAGGFAATLFGQLLNAEVIYSFNGQFEVTSLLGKSNAKTDPVIFRNADNEEISKYYDLCPYISHPDSIYYFHSSGCAWDKEQYAHVADKGINKISFKTSNHGIPFLKSNLPYVLNLPLEDLKKYVGKLMHPVTFSLSIVGLGKTLEGLGSIVKFGLNKIYIRTLQKWKT